jgi:hypothetical protein
MKKEVFWIVFVVLILASIGIFYFIFTKDDNKKVEQTQKVVHHLDEQTKERISSLEDRVLRLERDCQSPQVTTTQKPVTDTRTAPVKTAPTKASTSDLSHVENVHGQIIFCVMANDDGGMHFPQYALERGVSFTTVVSNITGDGNNWVVTPTETMEGDYGITHAGTFYVSHDVIQSTMSVDLYKLAIKAGFTGWQAKNMQREGKFWVYRTQ